MIEDKFAQYDSLIESRQEEHEKDDEEIERLKKIAEELKAAEQARIDRDASRRAAAKAALAPEEET